MKINRICIYAKDISLLTGKSLRYAQQMLNNIRFLNGKSRHQLITVNEFAKYSGMDTDEIYQALKL